MYQSTKDKTLARQVIKEMFEELKLELSDDMLDKKAKQILAISYSIGGGYDENELRRIAQSIIKREISK